MSLAAIATRDYTSSKTIEVAYLATAYARTANKSHLLPHIEEALGADQLMSLDGLECMLLLTNAYMDFGQPRRSWLVFRKALNVALLMVSHVASENWQLSLHTLIPGAAQRHSVRSAR